MTSDAVMLLFDIIILICGIYVLFSAVHMKKTGRPPALLLSEEEISMITDKKSFCGAMYRPALIFSAVSCLYGITALLNRYVLHQKTVRFLETVCFLIVCIWYVKEVRKLKEDYLI